MTPKHFWIYVTAIVLIAIALGIGKVRYAAHWQPPAGGVACTQEAKLCPDGSSVGRTGPNCEFAACPSNNNFVPKGILAGKVSIGPICPVERIDQPCPVPPEAYASREFLVLSVDQKQVASFHADAQGNYRISLASGVYTISSAKTGIGFMSKNLPQTITIQDGETTTLDIDVDTGIR